MAGQGFPARGGGAPDTFYGYFAGNLVEKG